MTGESRTSSTWLDVPASVVLDAQAGDALAMDALLEAMLPFVSRICGSIALSDGPDAVQETMIIVLRSLRSLREPAALAGWVTRIATREAVRAASRCIASCDTDVMPDLPARGDPQLAVDVRCVLEALSPHHRAVLVLREYADLDEATVAEILDVPIGTIKSRLSRARASFREQWSR